MALQIPVCCHQEVSLLGHFVAHTFGAHSGVFSASPPRGLIKLLNQLTTPVNTVKGELSAKRLRRGVVEMLRRRFARLLCEIKPGMELNGEGH